MFFLSQGLPQTKVMLSRTRFAGILAVNIGGRAVAQHSMAQILVGAAVGISLGATAYGRGTLGLK